jgi:hypothetical protein
MELKKKAVNDKFTAFFLNNRLDKRTKGRLRGPGPTFTQATGNP